MVDAEFLLLGDALWLDFVNTARYLARTDTLPDLAAYHRWAKACRLHSDADAVLFGEVRRLRAHLTLLADALETHAPLPSAALAAVNRCLGRREGCEQLVRESGRWQVRFEPHTVPRALTAIARSAALTLADPEARVARCRNTRCALRFLDTSPRHDRVWCSPARCGLAMTVDRRRGALR